MDIFPLVDNMEPFRSGRMVPRHFTRLKTVSHAARHILMSEAGFLPSVFDREFREKHVLFQLHHLHIRGAICCRFNSETIGTLCGGIAQVVKKLEGENRLSSSSEE